MVPGCSAATRVLHWLLAISVGLSAVSLVLLRVTPFDALRDPSAPLVQLLDVRSEQNLPTWFVVAVLAVAAVAHALVVLLTRGSGRPAWPWMLTAGLAAALSLDEAASLNERLEPLGRSLGGGAGLTHFAWLVPGAVVGGALLVLVVRAGRLLPGSSRRLVVGGFVVLVVSAVALEAVGGFVLDTWGDGLLYILLSHAEELLESFGACLLLTGALAAVRIRSDTTGAVTVTLLALPAVPYQRENRPEPSPESLGSPA